MALVVLIALIVGFFCELMKHNKQVENKQRQQSCNVSSRLATGQIWELHFALSGFLCKRGQTSKYFGKQPKQFVCKTYQQRKKTCERKHFVRFVERRPRRFDRRQKGRNIAFEQIAVIPYDEKVYCILKPIDEIENVDEEDFELEFYKKALWLCIQKNRAQTAIIQRELSVGFFRASKAMAWMDARKYTDSASLWC